MKMILVGIGISLGTAVSAQDSTGKSSPLTFSAFGEAYYSYDFNKPADNNRPSFFSSHNRHNEFNINIAYVKAGYHTNNTRANIAMAAGTYMNANYMAEPGVLKNIYEADIGLKLSGKKNLWVDAGVLPSHIGFESAHSPDCWILTRSIIADNSPYFEGGAKVTYTTDNGKWLICVLALNGWQRIKRLEGNSLISWGTQLQYRPSGKTTLNYSTFLGSDKPDSSSAWRHFHNFYGIFQLGEKWGLILDLDIGQQQVSKRSSSYNTWYGTASVIRFTPNPSWAVAARAEYYSDVNGVIIVTNTSNGFEVYGASLNMDRTINSNLLWRTELRALYSKDRIFIKAGNPGKNNTAITTSIAITF